MFAYHSGPDRSEQEPILARFWGERPRDTARHPEPPGNGYGTPQTRPLARPRGQDDGTTAEHRHGIRNHSAKFRLIVFGFGRFPSQFGIQFLHQAATMIPKEAATMLQGDRVLTVQEAARVLRVSPRTVLGYLQRGTLKGRRVGKAWLLLESALYRAIAGEDAPAGEAPAAPPVS